MYQEARLRSYQVQINVSSPLTLRFEDRPDDKELMWRMLNDLLTGLAIDAERQVRARLEQLRGQVTESGLVLDVPELREPMGGGYCITDVTGHVGERWHPKK